MPSSTPQSKSQQQTVVDLENGGETSQSGSSDVTLHAEGSSSMTPESRGTLEYSEDISRNGSRPAAWWKRTVDRVPQPVRRYTRKAVDWIKGPQPPRRYQIKPLFEPVQTFPVRILSRLPKAVLPGVLIFLFVLWIVLFGVIISKFGLPTDIGGFGRPVRVSCVNRLWPDSPTCGLEGRNCLPFEDVAFAFSCSADCAGVQVLNPRTIGDKQIIYQSLVVGGAPNASEADELFYRGDSFICGAAIHAGVIQDDRGGCGVVSLAGERDGYGSIFRNGIQSVGFNSSFPQSFKFIHDEQILSAANNCRDPRWNLLTLSTIVTAFIGLLSTSPAPFFIPIFIIVYFQIAMASDPPPSTDYPSLASTALASFLPAAFIGFFIYRFVVRKTLKNLRAQLEKTILWVGACWVGAMSNVTLEMIPIQRLTPHDLKQQPGAITALVFIVLIIFCVAVYQAWCFRNEGRLPRYLGLYAILGLGLLILVAIPRLDLRIHHYILGLLLLPGTSLQTRPSLLFQGLLVGLFINGVARWGFASILQTAAALRGDAQLGRGIPSINTPIINATNIIFSWDSLVRGYEGVSVLVNDVERFRGFHKNGDSAFTWMRHDMNHPEFFRFGFVNYLPFGGVTYSDFTKAGTWWPNGTWTDIPPGLS